MFENLIESKPKKDRTIGQTAVSVVVHIFLVLGAVKATQGAAETVKQILEDTTAVFIKPPEPPPPPPPDEVPPDVVVSNNPPPQGFQTIMPPDKIPTEIPPVNLNEKFDAKDFSGKGVEGGIAKGIIGGTGPVGDIIAGETFTQDQVDDPVAYIDGADPVFPPAMRGAGIAGRVTLQFIVGTDGRVERSSIKVMSSTNKAFEDPAVTAISRARFKPAKMRGQAVRQLVQQSIAFDIR
ncbi:MAG: energy transducer TonB [Gemmatimonadetes bacterium]|nr:energy transducer TonB [Gemmatimonadota bacterium]